MKGKIKDTKQSLLANAAIEKLFETENKLLKSQENGLTLQIRYVTFMGANLKRRHNKRFSY